jgi:hypothetical protein
MPPRRLVALLLLLAPLLLAASDPARDAVPCRPSAPGPGDAPDLVAARGSIAEGGTAVRWELTFADALAVPDLEGRPFRVDILVRDPTVPTVDVAYYRDLNRIVRFDALAQSGLVILLLPERGQNVFLAEQIDGRRFTIQVPGRMITRDLDLDGLPLEDLRWTVVVRDQHRCDVLGSARPHLRLSETAADEPAGGVHGEAGVAGSGGSPGLALAGGAGVVAAGVVAAGGYLAIRRRRDRSR